MYLLSGQPQLIFQKGQIEIEHFEQLNTLCVSWAGHISHDEYKFLLREILKFIRQLNIENLVVDARESGSVDRGNWNQTVCAFFKELGKTPLKRIARIGCGFLMREARISYLLTEIDKKHPFPVCFRYVHDVNSALEWFYDGGDHKPGIYLC